jgi:hypothetical protein
VLFWWCLISVVSHPINQRGRVGGHTAQAEKATQWHTTTTIRPIGSVCGCSALLRANSHFDRTPEWKRILFKPTAKEKKTRKEKRSTRARLRNVLIQILHDFYFISFRLSLYVYNRVIETRRSQKRIKSRQPIEYIGSAADSIVLFSFSNKFTD